MTRDHRQKSDGGATRVGSQCRKTKIYLTVTRNASTGDDNFFRHLFTNIFFSHFNNMRLRAVFGPSNDITAS